MRFCWRLLGILITCAPAWAGLATAYQDDTHFYIENDVLKIAVLRSTGSLDGIIHKQSGVNLQSRNVNNYPGIWAISLDSPAGSQLVQNTNATAFSGITSNDANGASLLLTWTGAALGSLTLPNITVTAGITVRTDSPLSFWTIKVDGLGGRQVQSLEYPYIPGIGPLGQSGADDILLTPLFKGMLYHNPTATVPPGTYPGLSYPSAGGGVQLLAYYDSTSGFYFATDDTQGYTKTWYWGNGSPAGDFTLNFQYSPAGPPSNTMQLPYNFILGTTQGDWYAAADTYRTWATQQSWSQQSRIKNVPAWLHDLPLIRNVCAHGCGSQSGGTYAQVVQDLSKSRQFLGVAATAWLEGWEKFGSWAFGDYFPPMEGWDAFDAMVQNMQPAKLRISASGLYLDTATSLYKSGAMNASAMLDAQGNPRTQPGAVTGQQWSFMDFSTDPWRQYIVGAYQTLAQHGVDVIQLDSSMEAGPQDCYNPSHQHPQGRGGNWQSAAWIDLTQRIAAAVTAANPNAALSAEEPAEIYLPYIAVHSGSAVDQLESPFTSAPNQEPVPLFQYVYHDKILFDDFFGPPALDGSFFRLALARDLIWGQTPNYQMQYGYQPAADNGLPYLSKAIALRTSARKFLVDGVMLPAPPLSVPATQVTWVADWQNNTQASAQFPSIQESAWRASDGSIGIVLTNISPNSVTFSLPIAYNRLQLVPGSAYSVQRTDGALSTTLDANMVKDTSYSITIASQQILLVQLTPTAPKPQISAGGVVLHASTSNTVSPGSLVDIYGTNLATSSGTAASGILPVLLGTTQVRINGIPAPLLYVSPTQIVAQVPGSVIVGPASVVVLNGGTASASAGINVQPATPFILSYGTNHAIVQNQDYSLNAATNPAAAGSAAVAYLVGSGPVVPAVDDGVGASASPLSWESLPTTVTVGGNSAQVFYAGLAPGFVGLVQVNFYVPSLPPGDYPVQITIGNARSNAPVMSVGN